MQHLPRLPVALICFVVCVSGCDCENRVRSWIDGREEPRKSTVDAGPKVSSEPVEVEPNDRPSEATPIRLTRELRPIRGATSDPTDADWFALSVDEDEPWIVDVSVESAADVAVEIDLGEASDIPLKYNVREAGKGELLQTLAVGREPLIVGVRTTTPAEYTLRFTKRLSGGAVEQEPNDIPGLANATSFPGEVQGFIDRLDDRDIYAVRSTEDTVAKLQVVGVPGVSLIVRVFGEPSFATPLASFSVPPDRRASIPNFFIPKSPEDRPPAYYIVITSAVGFDAEKAYRVRSVAEPRSDQLIELEPNDGLPMTLKTPQLSQMPGTLHGPDDIDSFAWGEWPELFGGDAGAADIESPDAGSAPDASVSSDAASASDSDAGVDPAEELIALLPTKAPPLPVAQLEVVPQEEWVTLGVEWEDDGGDTSAKASRAGESVKLCARQLPGARFRFSVKSADFAAPSEGTVADYLVNLSQPPVENLENEPNDSDGEADRLARGAERVGYLANTEDVDVWGIVVVPAGFAEDRFATTRFEATIKASEHDIMAELRDQDGGVVAKVDRAGVGAGEVVTVDLPKGLYYLHLRTKVGGSCEPYTVVTNLQ